MKFEQIVCVDRTGLTAAGAAALQQFSENEVVFYEDYPATAEEVARRIQQADCVLVSWNTRIPAEALRSARRLRYVGMCCSLYSPESANVDIHAAGQQGVTVRGVRDYGDEGVVEFIAAELIRLYKGLGERQWGAEPTELKGKTLGIIGLGTTGQMVARALPAFGMQVVYFSRTRRPELEGPELRWLPLEALLEASDVVSTHLPRRTCLLGAEQFARMKPGLVLVNTSLGPTFDLQAFFAWVSREGNYAILDADGAEGHAQEYRRYANILLSEKVAGMTVEARARLTHKVLENMREYLGGGQGWQGEPIHP